MRKILFLVAFNCTVFFTFCDAQTWQWAKGSSSTTVSMADAWPVATDKAGNVFISSMCGGDIMLDTFKIPSGTNTMMAKYDPTGAVVWVKKIVGENYPIGVAADQNGNSLFFGQMFDSVLRIGSTKLTNPIYPTGRYFIIKFDPQGSIIWAKSDGSLPPAGSYADAAPYNINIITVGAIKTDANNNIYITTNFQQPTTTIGSHVLVNANPVGTTNDIVVVKYDQAGNVIWATQSGGLDNEAPLGMTVTPAGDVYIAGTFRSPSINFGPATINSSSTYMGNAFIARYDASGSPVWACGSGGAGKEYACGIVSDDANNIYVTGGLGDAAISFNGTTITNPYPGSDVTFLVKFTPSNAVSWFKTIGSSTGKRAMPYSMAASPCGSVWINGVFGGKLNIDGHVLDTPSLRSPDPVFIAGFTFSGSYVGSAALQSGSDDQAGIACDPSGNVLVCSDYGLCNPFVIGKDTLAPIDQAFGVEWLYLAKYKPSATTATDTFSTHLDTVLCRNSQITIYAPIGYTDYLWSNGSTKQNATINVAGTYYVTAYGKCSEHALVDMISVNGGDCDAPDCIFLPNAFTPNNDGYNDFLRPLFASGCTITKYSLSIYNRWGNRVFYSEDVNEGWDGTRDGTKCGEGVYAYMLRYNYNTDNVRKMLKGNITLLR